LGVNTLLKFFLILFLSRKRMTAHRISLRKEEHMDWKFTGDRPIWQQLTEQLTLRILKGQYPPGERLPAVRELAAQAGVNPNTMQRALAQLEADGPAVGSRTAGRTVTQDYGAIEAAAKARARAAVADCLRVLSELGYTPSDALVFVKEELEHE